MMGQVNRIGGAVRLTPLLAARARSGRSNHISVEGSFMLLKAWYTVSCKI